jgi:hypothetical protein
MRKLVACLIIAVLVPVMVLIACGDGEQPSPTAMATPTPFATDVAQAGYLTFIDDINGLAIDYPGDWEPIPDEYMEWFAGEMGVTGFWAPVACGDFIANFNVVNEPLPFSMSVETYFDSSKRHLRSLEGYGPVSEEEITVNGMTAMRHLFNQTSDGDTIRQMQVYLVRDETGWVLTYSTSSSCWQQYEPVFNHMTDSFRFLD